MLIQKLIGQLILGYDRLWAVINNRIEKFELERPGLFEKNYIDRRALTYYNNEKVIANRMKREHQKLCQFLFLG